MKFLKAVFLLPVILIFFPALVSAQQEVSVFHSPSCHQCLKIKAEIIPAVEKKFKDKIAFKYYDINEVENFKLLVGLREKHRAVFKISLPVFYSSGKFLNGDKVTGLSLEKFLFHVLRNGASVGLSAGPVDLLARFRQITPLAVVSAGLIDGINPCAFTVIVFFVSFLALQGYRRRESAVVGLVFIFAVFLTYLLLGIGFFSFFYRLSSFWLAVKVFNLSVGILSIIFGFLAIYDFLKFRKAGLAEGMVLQLPQAIKNRIHALITSRFRKTKEEKFLPAKKRQIFILIIGALVTGFLVSLLEAVCTGQVYLPTIIFVLKTTPFKLQALAYLLLYNSLFILPLFAVFVFALLGVTSGQFAGFLKKHFALIKILMAALFLSLGVFLVQAQAAQITQEDKYAWDFGTIKEGAKYTHEFIFKNETDKLINIKGLNTSCGCMVSQVKKKNLNPGEETGVEVIFDSKKYSGPVTQFVYMDTDNLDNPVVRFIIKANVLKEE